MAKRKSTRTGAKKLCKQYPRRVASLLRKLDRIKREITRKSGFDSLEREVEVSGNSKAKATLRKIKSQHKAAALRWLKAR